MEQPALDIYLHTARISSALTQEELGSLLGLSGDYVRKCEKGERPPPLMFMVGCEFIFGKSAAELFPGAVRDIQDEIGRQAAKLDESLRGKTDPASMKKLALLSDIAKRAIGVPEV